MSLLHAAKEEEHPMPAFTLPPTRRCEIQRPGGVAVHPRAPSAPFSAVPALPETFWTFLARAWFFLAGVTIGVLLAAALIAIAAKVSPPRVGAKGAGAPAAPVEPAPI